MKITFFLLAALNAQNLFMENQMLNLNRDISDLNLIYNENYRYSLPRPILESFLSGIAFDNPELYTSEEAEKLKDDINELYQSILAKNPPQEKVAIITCGAPGAGKTIKLKQDLEASGKNYAYVCPDDVCLKNQHRTYMPDINNDGSKEARQKAYNKWRPASNAATHIILGNLIREQYAFYFGSTSSSPQTGKFFEFLINQGYRIKLIHVSASDDTRWKSIQERDKTFVQTTEQDVKEKGLLLPQRINDTFLKFADEIEFYYRNDVHEDAILAARWLRKEGTLQIIDSNQYEKIKTVHNEAAKVLMRPDLDWETAVEQSSKLLYT